MNILQLLAFVRLYITYIFQVRVKYCLSTKPVQLKQMSRVFSSAFCLTNFAPTSAFYATRQQSASNFPLDSFEGDPKPSRRKTEQRWEKGRSWSGICQIMVDYSLAQETHKLDYNAPLGSPLLNHCYTQERLKDCTSHRQKNEAFQCTEDFELIEGLRLKPLILACFNLICEVKITRVGTKLGLLRQVAQRALKCSSIVAGFKHAHRMILTWMFLSLVFQSCKFSFKALKSIRALALLALMVSMFSLSAQTPRKESGADGLSIKPVNIGDPIPAELWRLPLSALNYSNGQKTIRLSDFKSKKLIIIDFWATWCAPCIKMLPKLEGYRSKYGQDVTILAASDEAKEKIQAFSASSNTPVFTVYGDQILKKYFPRRALPHSIWIVDGKLLLSNTSDYITDNNILDAIRGKVIKEFKKTELVDYQDSIKLHEFLKESVIAKYGPNRAFYSSFNWHIGRLKKTKSYLRYINGGIEDMLYKLYSKDIPYYGRFNRLVFDIPDFVRELLRYDYEKFASMPIAERSKWNYQWKLDHYYCYEFINLDSTADFDPKTIFREDLRLFLSDKFGVGFSLKPLLRKQYFITVSPSDKESDSAGLKTENFFDPNTRKARFVNISLENILSIIAEQNKHNPIPIVWDKAFTDQLYSIDFDCSLQDLPSVFTILKKHGIQVELCERPLLSVYLTQSAMVRKEVSDEN